MKLEAIRASNLSICSVTRLSSLCVYAKAGFTERVANQDESECLQCWKFALLGKFPLNRSVADRRILSQKHSSLIDWKRCFWISSTKHWPSLQPVLPKHATRNTCNLNTVGKYSCFTAGKSGSINGISSNCSRYNKSASPAVSRGYVSASSGLTQQRICWNCGNPVTAMFICSVCGKIVEPPPFVSINDDNIESETISTSKTIPETAHKSLLNHAHNRRLTYFQIFQVEPKFDLDMETVKQQYRYIQALTHPDKFSSASDKEQEFSHQISSLVNRGWKTLQSPYSRGKYLLKIKRYTSATRSGQYNHSMNANSREFLQLIVEWNEILEDASSENAQSLQSLREKLLNARHGLLENVSKYFETDEFDKVDDCLAQLKYLDNISEKLKLNFDWTPMTFDL